MSDALFTSERQTIIGLAAQHHLAAIYEERVFAADGGLLSYGPDIPEIQRQAAVFVDKILKGSNPGDLPIEQPTRFELVINLNAAQTLGITIPPTLLATADEVIE